MIVDAICFALSGYFMKASDEFTDEKDNLFMAIVAGILCVFFTVYVSSINADATCIFISILVGTGLAFKVDTINHMISAVLLIILLYFFGQLNFSFLCLVLCTMAVFIDEKCNDFADKKEEEGLKLNFFEKLLKYRYLLKIVVFSLSLLGLIQIMVPNTILDGWLFFKPITIVYFYLFDLSYEFSNDLTDAINNVFQSFLRIF